MKINYFNYSPYILLILVILFTSNMHILKAQIFDATAHAKIALSNIKIIKNSGKIQINKGKISINKDNISRLRQTVKSELRAANKKLHRGNELSENLLDDTKKYHEYIIKDSDNEKTINLYIMKTSLLGNIRKTYKGIRKERENLSNYISNTNPEIITKQQKKMVMAGIDSIVDEAKVVFEQYDLLKLDEQMKMNDSERLEALKQLKSELQHIQELALYWKNRSIQSMELSQHRFKQGQSLQNLLGK